MMKCTEKYERHLVKISISNSVDTIHVWRKLLYSHFPQENITCEQKERENIVFKFINKLDEIITSFLSSHTPYSPLPEVPLDGKNIRFLLASSQVTMYCCNSMS